MKKKIVFITTLAIVLLGSYTDETKAASNIVNSSASTMTENTDSVKTSPKFVKQPLSASAIAGSKVDIGAVISGNPFPTVTVFKDGKPVKLDDRVRLSIDKKTGKVTFTIVNPKKEDEGTYMMEIRNSMGTEKVSFIIWVVII